MLVQWCVIFIENFFLFWTVCREGLDRSISHKTCSSALKPKQESRDGFILSPDAAPNHQRCGHNALQSKNSMHCLFQIFILTRNIEREFRNVFLNMNLPTFTVFHYSLSQTSPKFDLFCYPISTPLGDIIYGWSLIFHGFYFHIS